jgi:Tfp pilus assembly PilM family ATPase
MFIKTFFKLFPPPAYINIPYAGLDISDDAIRCIKYSEGRNGYILQCYGTRALRPGIVEAGYIKDEKALTTELISLVKELKISTVKASLPEERMYLFKTEVPRVDDDQIRQNIEFKLEENVPIPASDAIFFFDRLPDSLNNGKLYASVSVTPRDLVDSYLKALQSAGLTVVSFEIQAKAIGRSTVYRDSKDTKLIVNIMNNKTGLYIVSSGAICFTSTISWGGMLIRGKKIVEINDDITLLKKEIERVCAYWSQHGSSQTSSSSNNQSIKSIVITGRDAILVSQVSHLSPDSSIEVCVADIWQNAFSINHYVPKISFEDSLDYATAAGLALP